MWQTPVKNWMRGSWNSTVEQRCVLESEMRTNSSSLLCEQLASSTVRTGTNREEVDVRSLFNVNCDEVSEHHDPEEDPQTVLDDLEMVYERLELSGVMPMCHLVPADITPMNCGSASLKDATRFSTHGRDDVDCGFDGPLADLESVLAICAGEMDFTSFDGPLSDLEDVLRSCAKALDPSQEGQLADFQDMVNEECLVRTPSNVSEECVVRTPSKVSVSDFSFDSPLADLEDVLRICTKEIDLSSFDDPLSDLEDVLRTCAKPAEDSFQELLSNLEEIPWTFGRRDRSTERAENFGYDHCTNLQG